jgi:hypothetical protein
MQTYNHFDEGFTYLSESYTSAIQALSKRSTTSIIIPTMIKPEFFCIQF